MYIQKILDLLQLLLKWRPGQKTKYFVLIAVVVLLFTLYLSTPPKLLSSDATQSPINFVVEQGQGLENIATELKQLGIIRSKFIFVFANFLVGEPTVQAGHYSLDKIPNTFKLVKDLANNKVKREYKKITVPEGSTVAQIAEAAKKILPKFSESKFIDQASVHEGYLFPDTYFVDEGVDEAALLKLMLENFEEKTKGVLNGLDDKRRLEIVTMASILEEEGKSYESRQTIAGILYKRLEIGIALQVDATFIYVNGKRANITTKDLEIDSPFNTYKYRGLPPHPITNPGLDSIKAALNPIASPYLYYMSDSKGNIYYAKTFEEHKENRTKYQ